MVRRVIYLLLIVFGVAVAGLVGVRLVVGRDPLNRAMTMLANRDPAGAQVVLRTLIKAQPRSVEAHVLLAQTQILMSDWASAEKELKIARALKYDRSVLTPLLARALLAQERYTDVLTEVPPTAPNKDDQVMNLVLRSMAQVGLGDLGEARASIDSAAGLAPEAPMVLMQTARIALARKNPLEAERNAARALAIDPNNIDALVLQSEVQGQRWDTTAAIGSLNRAVSLAPLSAAVRLARANLLIGAGLDAKAQEDVDAAMGLAPQDATALYYNAWLMFRAKRYADAGVEFDKLGSMMSYFPKSFLFRGQCAQALHQNEAALANYYRYVKLKPADPEGIRLAAQLELDAGRPEKVTDLVNHAVEAGLRDAPSLDMLGRAYFMLGQVPEAIAVFRRAIAQAPDNKDIGAHLAAAQTRFGDAPAEAAVKAVE